MRTVSALIANPGPDGISLREAIEATNNDPGVYTIRFAAALAGKTISLVQSEGGSLVLTGGGVTVEGDIDGNGEPDVTIRPGSSMPPNAFVITSSRNRLHALALDGFITGVNIQPAVRPGRPVEGGSLSHRTFADNEVSDLVIRTIAAGPGVYGGIMLRSAGCPSFPLACTTYNRWTGTTITGNTIETNEFGILVQVDASGDRVEGVRVTGNAVQQGTSGRPARGGSAIMIGSGVSARQTRIADVLIARNAIDGVNGDGPIVVGSGLQRAQANAIERVRILDNRIRLVKKGSGCCPLQGIVVYAGNDSGLLIHVRPVRYPDKNVVRDVRIAGNSVSGSVGDGIKLGAGVDGGGSRNRIENVRIERNRVRSTIIGRGVQLWTGLLFHPAYATGNRITDVTINANRITTGRKPGVLAKDATGGIVLLAGWDYSRRGVVKNVRITNNRIASAQAGIRLIGGIGPRARGNSVTCVRLRRNRITGTRNAVVVSPNLRGRPGQHPTPGAASGNRASLGGC